MGVIGIKTRGRSIEGMADADGACPQFARVDRPDLRQRRRRPRVLVVTDPTPACRNNPNARSSQMRFVVINVIRVLGFLRRSNVVCVEGANCGYLSTAPPLAPTDTSFFGAILAVLWPAVKFAWYIGFRDSERSPTVDWRRRRTLGIRRIAGGRQLPLLVST